MDSPPACYAPAVPPFDPEPEDELSLEELQKLRDRNRRTLERAFAEVVRLESLIALERRRLGQLESDDELDSQSAG